VRVELKTIGIAAVTHNCYTTKDPRHLNDKLTLLFELRQARRICSHFLFITAIGFRCELISSWPTSEVY